MKRTINSHVFRPVKSTTLSSWTTAREPKHIIRNSSFVLLGLTAGCAIWSRQWRLQDRHHKSLYPQWEYVSSVHFWLELVWWTGVRHVDVLWDTFSVYTSFCSCHISHFILHHPILCLKDFNNFIVCAFHSLEMFSNFSFLFRMWINRQVPAASLDMTTCYTCQHCSLYNKLYYV